MEVIDSHGTREAVLDFEPVSGDHAIVEVVWGLRFARAFNPLEIQSLVKEHALWKADLPKMGRIGGIQLTIGDQASFGVSQQTQDTGVSFERMKPDGSLDWRLLIEQDRVFVNCLSYSRWSEVWPKVLAYLDSVAEIAVAPDNFVASVILQYIDIFRWTAAAEKYELSKLLKSGEHVPAALFEKGPLWHLHQGWFTTAVSGRMLERVNVEGVESETGMLVKIDTYLQLQASQPASWQNVRTNGWLESEFVSMHKKNKNLLLEFLTPEMAERVGLDATG